MGWLIRLQWVKKRWMMEWTRRRGLVVRLEVLLPCKGFKERGVGSCTGKTYLS
jgi:hypothetical protein